MKLKILFIFASIIPAFSYAEKSDSPKPAIHRDVAAIAGSLNCEARYVAYSSTKNEASSQKIYKKNVPIDSEAAALVWTEQEFSAVIGYLKGHFTVIVLEKSSGESMVAPVSLQPSHENVRFDFQFSRGHSILEIVCQ